MTPYKFGGVLAGLILLAALITSLFMQEILMVIPLYILGVGMIILILYFLLVYIHSKVSEKVFLTIILIPVLMIGLYIGKIQYEDWHGQKRFESWQTAPVRGVLEINKTVTIDSEHPTDEIIKYKIVIPQDGSLLIDCPTNDFTEQVVMYVFNNKPDSWIVSAKNENDSGVHVYKVQKGEEYYLVIDQKNLIQQGRSGFSYELTPKITAIEM
ncbi:hypothetical protein [Brevibacillus dissolubilis]|uniref:hypothetical protein n=1 Tax=Brevibacillus dissolubilis TaxID=1844116 RepID=UPI0011162EA4|nr:hypothetical protein [Brevibacillus dissolubilis]